MDDNIHRFLDKLVNDEAFRAKFEGVKSAEEAVQVAGENGFTFEVNSLRTTMEAFYKQVKSEPGALSAKELDMVSGGESAEDRARASAAAAAAAAA